MMNRKRVSKILFKEKYGMMEPGKKRFRSLWGTAFAALSLFGMSACSAPWIVPEDAEQAQIKSVSEDAPEVMAEEIVLPDGPVQALYHDESISCDYAFGTTEEYMTVYDGTAFREVYLNGVNIGSGYPGSFPGELRIPEEAYLRWFKDISDMHCNVIRVYTTMMPDFYNAFYEYNRRADADSKLYLLMGVWYDETTMMETGDAYDLLEGAKKEAMEQVDIIHGDCEIPQRTGHAWGEYTADVSPYVMGWILGIESDAFLVGTTNEKHPEINSYDGEYLYTRGEDVKAFDAFLCELGDTAISYETEKYGMQRPVSWANWPTADVMDHPDEPSFEVEDAVTIHVERFKTKENFKPGIFASYHIYPYYPEFMMLEDTYTQYRDTSGNTDPYEAYLKQLRETHHVPVVVAEYGLPASRGCTHVNPYSHYDQGHLNEKEQGDGLAFLAEDIFENGYAGGIVFTWQDEWFKRTWNTMDYSDANRRAFWSDIQTSEQNFGLLSFDPGAEEMVIKVDGKADDWKTGDVLYSDGKFTLSMQKDARYLYLSVKGTDYEPETDRLLLPLDITEISGSTEYAGVEKNESLVGSALAWVDPTKDTDGATMEHMRMKDPEDVAAGRIISASQNSANYVKCAVDSASDMSMVSGNVVPELQPATFDRPVDFVIDVNGREDTHVYVQSYYDRYAFLYQDIDNLIDITGYDVKDSHRFVPIYLSLNKQLAIPTTGELKDAMHYETGWLRHGNADPAAEDYDSLVDFSFGEGFMEMRIPWSLLNFRDPSTKEVEGDFWEADELTGKNVDGIWVGLNCKDSAFPMQYFTWDNWDTIEFHERLKQSYHILSACYEKLTLDH